VVLRWSYPSHTAAGEPLTRVDRLIVYRLRERLPEELAGRTGTEIIQAEGAEVPAPIALFNRVPPVPPQAFRNLAERIGTLEREQIPSFTTGAVVVVEDRPQLLSEAGAPLRYTYAVAAVTGRQESELSNLAAIVPLDVPRPPESVAMETEPEGVELRWTPPAATILGSDDPTIAGYNVYRLPLGAVGVLTAQPVNDALITGTSYRDVPPYGTWNYAVTAVRHEGEPLQESQFPLLRTAEFSDRLAPPTPEDLSPLVEERVIRLVWTGVEAPDLAGYRVYRQATGRPHIELTTDPISETSFIDETVERGVEYRYGVTSVDTTGNESPPAVSEPVLIPR
jgi:hypothetical protein